MQIVSNRYGHFGFVEIIIGSGVVVAFSSVNS